jgi:hypothetical protein
VAIPEQARPDRFLTEAQRKSGLRGRPSPELARKLLAHQVQYKIWWSQILKNNPSLIKALVQRGYTDIPRLDCCFLRSLINKVKQEYSLLKP